MVGMIRAKCNPTTITWCAQLAHEDVMANAPSYFAVQKGHGQSATTYISCGSTLDADSD
jgi:hypothetical protein